MIKPSDSKNVCAHCKSPKIQYYGATYGGYHYYYKCPDCQKYTEQYISLNKMRVMYFVVYFLIMAPSIVAFLILLDLDPGLAILFCLATTLLFAIFSYKYRWCAVEYRVAGTIALDNLPSDRWIIRPAKGIRFIIGVLFIAAITAYVAIFFLNLARQ